MVTILRNPITIAIALALTGPPLAAQAQDARVLVQTEIGRALGQVGQQLGRDISRSVREATRGIDGVRGVPHSFEQSRDYKFEQTATETKTLAIGATGELTLKNIVGDITVKPGSGRDVTVEIVRTSRGKTEADAKLGLERVRAEVTARAERGSVDVRYPNELHPNYAVSAAFNVTAPAGTRVAVDTTTGHVRITDMQGEVKVGTVSGAVDLTGCARVDAVHTIAGDITLTNTRSEGRIEIGSVSAALRLTNIKAQRVAANVISGLISARDIQADGVEMGSLSGNIEFSGTVSAKGRYEFQAHSGNVRLAITGGFDLEGRTFSGRVEADPALNLTGTVPASTTGRQRSLRGVAGNGGAAVVATTFSGNVWVGRKLN